MISHECNDVKSIMIKAIILAILCFMIIYHIMFIGRGEGSRTLYKNGFADRCPAVEHLRDGADSMNTCKHSAKTHINGILTADHMKHE